MKPEQREQIVERLYSAVLSDVMDGLGLMEQALKPFVRPLDEALVLFGRARTGLYMPRYQVADGEDPYAIEIALVDDLQPGDVAVFACGGPTDRIAPWGELLTTAAQVRGATGCLTDGLIRDIKPIREMGFPVLHGGIGPLDSKGRGKMMEMDCRVVCGGVAVCVAVAVAIAVAVSRAVGVASGLLVAVSAAVEVAVGSGLALC